LKRSGRWGGKGKARGSSGRREKTRLSHFVRRGKTNHLKKSPLRKGGGEGKEDRHLNRKAKGRRGGIVREKRVGRLKVRKQSFYSPFRGGRRSPRVTNKEKKRETLSRDKQRKAALGRGGFGRRKLFCRRKKRGVWRAAREKKKRRNNKVNGKKLDAARETERPLLIREIAGFAHGRGGKNNDGKENQVTPGGEEGGSNALFLKGGRRHTPKKKKRTQTSTPFSKGKERGGTSLPERGRKTITLLSKEPRPKKGEITLRKVLAVEEKETPGDAQDD